MKADTEKDMEAESDKLNTIIDKYAGEKGVLISILQDIQSEYNYLPQDMLKQVAEKLEMPFSQVYGVATFYTAFSLKPRGKHLIKVCLGTACHVRGAQRVLEMIERKLGIKAGETTEDFNFTLETVNCLGCCAMGPVVVVDNKYHTTISSKVDTVLKKYEVS